VPGNGRGRRPAADDGPDQHNTTATSGTTTKGSTVMLPEAGDPRRIGELLGDWLSIRMAEVDDLVTEARSRVEAIPDLRALWLLAGEILVRLAAVEHELAELRKAAKR
jgi:hypothetical protein